VTIPNYDEWKCREPEQEPASICDSIAAFCDGEISTTRAYAFRDHLADCAECRDGVAEHLRLCARISELRPEIETQPVRVPAGDD